MKESYCGGGPHAAGLVISVGFTGFFLSGRQDHVVEAPALDFFLLQKKAA